MASDIIGHYRLEEQLGTGGMGTVYRAVNVRLGRAVALKFLREEFAGRPEILARFEREARAISALNHPNICTLHDIGDDAGRPYLVMEYLEGTTVGERVAKKPFTVEELLEIGAQVAGALEAAHRRGLVHRDIKPSNIFLTASGQAKVLDFGIAKKREVLTSFAQAVGEDGQTATVTAMPQLTVQGSVTGTAGYMSPEQIRGEEVDARSDVFSFGATMYEITTGQRAFPGHTLTETSAAVLERHPVPPRELRPELPAALSDAILTALEKDKAARCRHMEMSRLTSDGNALSAAISPDGR